MTQNERDTWVRRKQSELGALHSWLDDVARDRAQGKLTPEEIVELARAARDKGRSLTDPEANMWLAQYRQSGEL